MYGTETWPTVATATGTGATITGDRVWVVDGLTTPDFAVASSIYATGINSIGCATADTNQKNWMRSQFTMDTANQFLRGRVFLREEGSGQVHSFRFNVRMTDHGGSVYSYYHVQAVRHVTGYQRNIVRVDSNNSTTLYQDTTDPGEAFEMGIIANGPTLTAWWGATVVTVTDTNLTTGAYIGFNTGPDNGTTPSYTQAYNMVFGDVTHAVGRVSRRARVFR